MKTNISNKISSTNPKYNEEVFVRIKSNYPKPITWVGIYESLSLIK